MKKTKRTATTLKATRTTRATAEEPRAPRKSASLKATRIVKPLGKVPVKSYLAVPKKTVRKPLKPVEKPEPIELVETVETVDTVEQTQVSSRGGARRGAGRPKGSGKYGKPTKALRVPIDLVEYVDDFVERNGYVFPVYDNHIQAGFPSPAGDTSAETFNLGTKLVPNPASTYFLKVVGESMRDAGIFPDDILIVDRSLEATNGDVIVASIDGGDFTVKRLFKTRTRTELRPENPHFERIIVTEDMELNIFGVVRTVIHNV